MPQNLLSGKQGYVEIGTTMYSFGKFDLEMDATLVPVPNFNSAGYMQRVVGLISGKLTVTGPYDAGNMPFTAGESYVWILGLSSTISITLTAIVESIKMAEDVEGAPMVTIVAESNGSFTAAIT